MPENCELNKSAFCYFISCLISFQNLIKFPYTLSFSDMTREGSLFCTRVSNLKNTKHQNNQFLKNKAFITLGVLGFVFVYLGWKFICNITEKVRNKKKFSKIIDDLETKNLLVRNAKLNHRLELLILEVRNEINKYQKRNPLSKIMDKESIYKPDENTPSDYVCLITREIMRDPVMIVEEKKNYERSALQMWYEVGLQTKGFQSCIICRDCRMKNPRMLSTNYQLKNQIQSYLLDKISSIKLLSR